MLTCLNVLSLKREHVDYFTVLKMSSPLDVIEEFLYLLIVATILIYWVTYEPFSDLSFKLCILQSEKDGFYHFVV